MKHLQPVTDRPETTAAPVATPAAAPRPSGRRRLEHYSRYAILVAWAMVIVVFGVLTPDTFLTSANASSILSSQSVLVVLTLGLILPLRCGDYDLSIAGVLSLSAMIVAVLNVQHGWPIGAAILVALAAGLVVGVINGALIVGLGIDSLIVTLGSGTFLTGVVLWISSSNTIGGVSDTLVNLVVGKSVLGIPVGVAYGIVLCAVLSYLFEFTALGRRMLFVGQNRSVARLSGVRVRSVRRGALMGSGVVAALAGVLYAGTTGAADPSSGQSFLLPAFAGAFLGATSIIPGQFNPWGTLVAVYFLITGITGLQLLGVASFVQQLFYGGALIIAVALSQLVKGDRKFEESGS